MAEPRTSPPPTVVRGGETERPPVVAAEGGEPGDGEEAQARSGATPGDVGEGVVTETEAPLGVDSGSVALVGTVVMVGGLCAMVLLGRLRQERS